MPANAEIIPLFNPEERKLVLGNILAAPFTGGIATGVGGALGGLLAMKLHAHPQTGKAVQDLFGPHPLHAGAYGSILGYLLAKSATGKEQRRN